MQWLRQHAIQRKETTRYQVNSTEVERLVAERARAWEQHNEQEANRLTHTHCDVPAGGKESRH
eukprot:837940-Prorocentrum_lima.AAC.1